MPWGSALRPLPRAWRHQSRAPARAVPASASFLRREKRAPPPARAGGRTHPATCPSAEEWRRETATGNRSGRERVGRTSGRRTTMSFPPECDRMRSSRGARSSRDGVGRGGGNAGSQCVGGPECVEDALRALEREAGNGGNLLGRRLANGLYAAEGAQKRAATVVADAGNAKELRRDRTDGSSLSLKRNREAMRFVARLLEHAERRGAARQAGWFAPAQHENFFLAFVE